MSADDIFDQGARPMPEFVKRGLVVVQGGQRYLKAPYRVLWMREEHPDWSISTEIVYADYTAGYVVVKATIADGDGRVLATAHSEEKRGAFPMVEKAETGAIARALGLCGYGTQFGELDEEEFADSPQAANGHDRQPATPSAGRAMPMNDSGGLCVSCSAPHGKPHTRNCKAVK